MIARSLESAGRLSRMAERLSGRVVSWFGLEGPLPRAAPPRLLCAVLAAAIVANGLTLFLFRKEVAPWGVILRGVGLGVALLGLRYQGDWESLRGSSVLMRLLRVFGWGR